MSVTLYSTGCPKCTILKKKLEQAGIEYNIVSDIDTMTRMGFTSVPVIRVGDKIMDFKNSIEWINNEAKT